MATLDAQAPLVQARLGGIGMLIHLADLQGASIRAVDGEFGIVNDFYFDDEHWAIRYLVVETGTWLHSRKVLVTPLSIGVPDPVGNVIPVTITREQVANSPDIDTDQPVSRQHETDYLAYYGYPVYWGGAGLWGGEPFPGMLSGMGYLSEPALVDPQTQTALAEANARRHAHDDPHLRSCANVVGYHLKASDGEIGHVAGYLVDDRSWALRYLVVDTRNWWPGQKVLIAPQWIGAVNWEDATVTVDLSRESVKAAPAFDPSALPTGEQEASIHRHYDRL